MVGGERGSGCLDVGDVLRCSGSSSNVIWARDVGYLFMHWEDLGRILPQGGPHNDEASTAEGNGWAVCVAPSGGGDGRGRSAGGGDLYCPSSEHS